LTPPPPDPIEYDLGMTYYTAAWIVLAIDLLAWVFEPWGPQSWAGLGAVTLFSLIGKFFTYADSQQRKER
jgi:hypothetical protein